MPDEQDFQQLKDQVAALASQLNAAKNRIDELENFATDHLGLDWGTSMTDVNSPHPNMSIDTGEFGGGMMRLDQNGIQVRANAGNVSAMFFVNELQTKVTNAEVYSYILGRVDMDVTANWDSAQYQAGSFASHNDRTKTCGGYFSANQNLGVGDDIASYGAYLNSFYSPGGIAGYLYSESTSSKTVNGSLGSEFRLLANGTAAQPIYLVGAANDPSSLSNGMVWYNSTDNKLYARINGATVELGGGGSMPMPPIVGTVSWNCLGAELAAMKNSVTTPAASTAWPAANRAIYIPVKVTEDCTVTKLWVYNGATASGNINMCLYNSSFAQVANTEIGSTAQSGTNVVQEFDITNTALTAGLYYIACVFSSGTGTAWAFATSGDTPVELLQSWGMAQEAIGSVDLPATATPAAVASVYTPIMGMSISPRTLVT